MIWRSAVLGLKVGMVSGVVAMLVFSLWDWILNPGGIFHDAHGTNWPIVVETAASWLIPTFLIVWASVAIVHIGWSYLHRYLERGDS